MTGNADGYKKYMDMRISGEYLRLQQFYHTKTIFDILGVARQENPHSNFIAWLLNPQESHKMGDYPVKVFLQSLCVAFWNVGQYYLTEENVSYQQYGELQAAAKERLLFFMGEAETAADAKGKLTERGRLLRTILFSDYDIIFHKISREETLEGKRRADILMELTIQPSDRNLLPRDKRLLILIENKVKSEEHDEQTRAYMKALLKRDCEYIIPIFLYPAKGAEYMSDWKRGGRCQDKMFFLFTYQQLLDGVITPCRQKYQNLPVSEILSEYTVCLGKSLDETDVDSQSAIRGVLPTASYTVMATGRGEKQWALRLWREHHDILSQICAELTGKTDEKLLTLNQNDEQFYLTVLEAVSSALEESGDGGEAHNAQTEEIRAALNSTRKVAAYYVKQADGTYREFASRRRGRQSLGALAYVLIRQYIMRHKDMSAEEIREKLAPVTHSWLREKLVTGAELQEMGTACLDFYRVCPAKKECPVCKTATMDEAVFQNCPSNRTDNNPCYRYYSFFNYYFVGGLQSVVWPWAENAALDLGGHAYSGINRELGAIRVDGWKDKDVYVARFWSLPTLNQLVDLLDMRGYVSTDKSRIAATLDFNF